MLEIRTYLKVSGGLECYKNFEGFVHDPSYVEGSIEVAYQDKILVSRTVVDLVDQIWGYIINGIEEISQGRSYMGYYPDMPARLSILLRKSCRIEFQVYDARLNLDRNEFCRYVLGCGRDFFEKMIAINSSMSGVYENYIRKIDLLSNKFQVR